MAVLEVGKNLKGGIIMNADKAGRIKGKAKSKRKKVCGHGRMVNDHYDDQSQTTGNVVCLECGAVIPDLAKVVR